MTLSDVVMMVAALLGGLFAVDFLRNKYTSKQVDKFNEQRAEALALDKQIDKLKSEVIRDTADFEERLAKHRAKYGSPKRPGEDS